MYAHLNGEEWRDADSPGWDLEDEPSHHPTLFLMGQGYKRDVRNIVKTFPLPPLPKIDGGDLNRLVEELVALIKQSDEP